MTVSRVSRAVGAILEEEDIITGTVIIWKFLLRVLSELLSGKKHYVSAIDEKVQISFADGENIITSIGILKEVLPESIKIEFEDSVKEIQLTDVKKAKTYFDYKK